MYNFILYQYKMGKITRETVIKMKDAWLTEEEIANILT